MAPHRKIPLFLLPILLILLAGAVVLLVRGQPLTLERIFHRQGYAITGQTETALTLTLSRDQMPEGFPEEVPISQAEGELELLLYQDRDTSFYLTAFAQSNQDSDILHASIELRHQLSREGGELLLPYQVNEDGSITVGLGIDRESVLADGEARPEAVLLAGQSSSRFDLYIDRALFLRSDEITFQIGPFYYLTYESTLLIKNARYIVSCDDRDTLHEHSNLFIRDNAIEYIGPELRQADQVIDASTMAVYPGLINTHHHLYQLFSRNLPEVQRMELFPWLVTLYEVWKNLDEEVVTASTQVGLAELLKTGCTTCFDHHYVFPNRAGDLIGAQFRAAERLGMRFHASRGSMDLSKKDGGLPPDSVVQDIDAILADSERLVRVWHDPARFSMRQVALAPCSPFSVSTDLLRESARLARALGVRLHTHVAETKDEEQYTLEKFGLRPLAYLEGLGWTGPDVWYAHGIHFNDEELDVLAATGTGVAHCPISNMKLSSGVCRVPDMLRRGVPVGLAVDGAASNDGSNLLEELRVCYLLHRLNWSQNAPTGYDILKIATRGSARLLGRDDIGYLAAGMAADCFLIDLERVELAGAQFDPMSLLGTVGFKGPVDYTIVNGVPVVQRGELVTADEAELTAQANGTVRRYLGRL